MLRVWHNDTTFSDRRNDPAVFPADFTAVAEVNTVWPHDAFELTNTIHFPWWHNTGVKLLTLPPSRSTSVGDIIEDMDGGALLLVKGFGFGKLDGPNPVITWRDHYAA